MYKYRPHHFLCTVGFQGRGYSPEFVAGFSKIKSSLESPGGENIEIEVTAVSDDSICSPCPNRLEKTCTTEAKIQKLDQGHARVLEIKSGDRLTWGEAKSRIKDRIDEEVFEEICASCNWKPLGVCLESLKALRAMAIVGITVGFAILGGSTEASAREKLIPISKVEKYLYGPRARKNAVTAKKVARATYFFEKGNYFRARKIARTFRNHHDYADYAHFIIGQSYRKEGEQHLRHKRWDSAIKFARKAITPLSVVMTVVPYSPLKRKAPIELGRVELLLGDAYFGKHYWKTAQKHYVRSFHHYVETKKLREIDVKSLGNYSRACAKVFMEQCKLWMYRFADFYPKSSREIKAITKYNPKVLSHYYSRPKDKPITKTYLSTPPDQEAFNEAMKEYLERDYSDAKDLFEKLLEEYPRSTHRHRAMFWLAQAHVHEQDHDKAQDIFNRILSESPLSYYGMLAAVSGGKRHHKFIQGTLPRVSLRDPRLRPSDLERLKRAEEFLAHKAYELAAENLKQIGPRKTYSKYFLTYLAKLNYEARAHRRSFAFLSRLFTVGHEEVNSTYGLKMIFPVKFESKIREAAEKVDLDPLLVFSLIKQESAFDARAESWVGAQGLMQVMPTTALGVEPKVKQRKLVDPDTNIRLGTKYLKGLMKRFDGNIPLALAGYNAGPGRANSWRRKAKEGISMLEFIETIPYRETRNYVMSIMRNYYWYHYQTHNRGIDSLDYFWGATPSEVKNSSSASGRRTKRSKAST